MLTFFENLINPFDPKQPTKPPSTLFAFCLHYLQGSKRFFALMASFTILSALSEVYVFHFLGQLVDWLSSSSPGTFLDEFSRPLLMISVVVLLIQPMSSFMFIVVSHQTILGNFPMTIRWLSHRYLLDQSLSFYQGEFAGRIATKMMQTSLSVRETIVKILDVILYSFIFFVGILVVSSSMDWRLGMPLLMWLISYIALLYYFIPKLGKVSQAQSDARSEMTGRLVDTYTNITTVKLFSHSNREAQYAKESMANFLGTVHPQMRLVTFFCTGVWVINALLIFSIIALSIKLWSINTVSTGAIATAIAVVLRLYGVSQWVMWEVAGLFEHIGTVQDGISTLSQQHSIVDQEHAPPLAIHNGAIDFRNVSFHYGKSEGVIEQFNLSIQPGEKVGLVGRSGAGKSTLVNLLLRFYDPEQGGIYIDNQNITTVTQNSLRGQIGVVTQDTSLLHRSIGDNIRYGKPSATETEVWDAAKQASAHEFIVELTDKHGRKGYDAHVGERGVMLSGGQRQRISIARVLLKNAPILVLDEATSALDSEVEGVIQENLNKLMEKKTVIAIAHRLSTIAAMDRLIVIDKGAIVEQGAHLQLLENKGLYAKLWARQSRGLIGEDV